MKLKGQTSLEVPKDLRHLPSTVAELVPLYRACIVRFDAAVHARDFGAANVERGEAHDIVERAFSSDRFQFPQYRYCFMDVARIFDRLTRAAPGTVPLFGQQGDFVASLSIVRVRFKVSGLSSDIGASAYSSRVMGFSINAVEWERPFYTDTGFRSFLCSSLEVGERSDNVQDWCMVHVRHWWNGEGGRATKFGLHRIRRYTPAPVAVAQAEEDTFSPPCLPDKPASQLSLFSA